MAYSLLETYNHTKESQLTVHVDEDSMKEFRKRFLET